MTFPQPFAFGKRLQDGLDLDGALASPVWSTSRPLTAVIGGTRTTSTKIVETIANVGTVAAAGAGVTLPVAVPGKVLLVFNNGANDLRVFADDPSIVDGIAGDIGVLVASASMTMFVAQELRKWTYTTLALYTPPNRSYLSAYSDVTQVNTDVTIPQIMTVNNVVTSSGISVVAGTKLSVATSGIYNLQFSAQLDKTDSGRDAIEIWLRKNGTDEPWSNTWVEADSNNAKVVAAWNFVLPLNAGDYLELAWWSADVDMRLFARTASAAVPGVSPARPAIPSIIVTMTGV